MRPRGPRFAFLLIAMLALLAGVFVLGRSGPQRLGPPSAIGAKPVRACETAQATAERTAHATLRTKVKAQLPVTVTAHAEARGRIAVGTLSETVVERIELAQPVTVQRAAVVQRRACATADTAQAARGRALTSAYRSALRAAQREAAAQARRDANELLARMTPLQLASARRLASSRARSAAKTLKLRLASAAMAAARARAQVPGTR